MKTHLCRLQFILGACLALADSAQIRTALTAENTQEYFPDSKAETLQCFHYIMTKANWTYFIAEGTLIGATRNGFILPWDRDIDVVFDARTLGHDYAKFRNLFLRDAVAQAVSEGCTACKGRVLMRQGGGTDEHGRELNGYQIDDDLIAGTPRYWRNWEFAPSNKSRYAPMLFGGKTLFRLTLDNNWLDYYIDVMPAVPALARVNSERQGKGLPRSARPDPANPDAWSTTKEGGKLKFFGVPCKASFEESYFLPTQPCKILQFGKDRVWEIHTRCPPNPEGYLERCYGKNWMIDPYTVYRERWTFAGDVTLLDTVRQRLNYTGKVTPYMPVGRSFLRGRTET